MKRKALVFILVVLPLLCASAYAITAVEGTVQRFDRTARTIVVKAADGTEHTFHFVGRTAVHGVEKTDAAANDSFHGLKEGGHVVMHYSRKGSRETAEEIDRVGEGGMKSAEGTVTHLDRGAKTVTVRTVDWIRASISPDGPRGARRWQGRFRRSRKIRQGDRLLYRGSWS